MIHYYFTHCFNNDEAEGLWKLVVGYVPFLFWWVWVGKMSHFHGTQNCCHCWPMLQHEFVFQYRRPSHTANKYIVNLPWVYSGITSREGGENLIRLNVPLRYPLAKTRDNLFPRANSFHTNGKGLEKPGVSIAVVLLLVSSRVIWLGI